MISPKPCYRCRKNIYTVLVTYPDGDKWTCLTCLKKYQKKTKSSFDG